MSMDNPYDPYLHRSLLPLLRVRHFLNKHSPRSLDPQHAIDLEHVVGDGFGVVDADGAHHLQQPRPVDQQIHVRGGLLDLVQHRAMDGRNSVHDHLGEHFFEALQREILVVAAVSVRWM